MTLCPQCGAVNRPEARFCKVCRAPLPAAACPTCGEPLRAGARFCRRCGRPVADGTAAASALPTSCPRCGKPVRPGARFCPYCGTSLSGTVAISCPRCGKPVRPGARFCASCGAPLPTLPDVSRRCPYCGAPVRPGARFCSRCSRPLTALSPPPVPSPPVPPALMPGVFGTGELLPLSTLAGRYVILEKIAQGGMGAVYKAQDKRLNHQVVAVKEMSESAIQSEDREEILKAFQREARLLARLSHPNIVWVSDYFQEGERHYMVMEFIQGRTLEDMLEEQSEPFPEEQVLVWAEQLCDVLTYLHSQSPKIIYRDLKPGNVMVVEGTDTVKLIDFGIARFYKPGKQKDTIILGTPGYAPPEQYGKGRAAQTDERSDIYALGAMLHQLLSLRDPTQHLFDFPPLRKLNPKVGRHVEEAIARAVEKERSRRFASAEEMKQALLGGKPLPKPAGAPAPAPKKRPARAIRSLQISPSSLDWGQVVRGSIAPPVSLQVTHPAGAQITVAPDVPWLQTHVAPVDDETAEIQVFLSTHSLPLGQLQISGDGIQSWIGGHARLFVPASRSLQGRIEIALEDGQKETVPVSLVAVPSRERVMWGWVVTVGLLLLELMACLYLLAILCGGSA